MELTVEKKEERHQYPQIITEADWIRTLKKPTSRLPSAGGARQSGLIFSRSYKFYSAQKKHDEAVKNESAMAGFTNAYVAPGQTTTMTLKKFLPVG